MRYNTYNADIEKFKALIGYDVNDMFILLSSKSIVLEFSHH